MFAGRTYSEIRTQFLSTLSSYYTQAGYTLLTAVGSDAWMMGGAIGLLHMGLEAQAETLQDQILPDRAQTDFLNRHGVVDGVDRRDATSAQLTLTVTGTPAASTTLAGKSFVDTVGNRFTPTDVSVTLNGGGTGTVAVTAAIGGVDSNQSVGAILTWVAAPAGFNATATVATVVVVAEDEEVDADYATRIIENRQRRASSGNREDWRTWAEDVDGVDEAYVYPLVSGDTTGTVGTVKIVALGPEQGSSATRTRIVSGTVLTNIANYVEGTHDIHGVAIAAAEQVQKRPVTIGTSAYAFVAATETEQDVAMTIAPVTGSEFSYTDFGGGYTVSAATSTTAFTITPAPDTRVVAERPAVNDTIAVEYNLSGANSVRGGYALTTITAVNIVTGAVTVSPALPYTPLVGYDVKPSAPFWATIRDAIFVLFDDLGPGDTDQSPASPLVATRWPTQDVQGRSRLYTVRLLNAALNATGVLSATLTTPGADVVPNAFRLLVLGKLTLSA